MTEAISGQELQGQFEAKHQALLAAQDHARLLLAERSRLNADLSLLVAAHDFEDIAVVHMKIAAIDAELVKIGL